jgi:hypothetical protein
MCLVLAVTAPATDRAILEAAAVEASAAGLRVNVEHHSPWPWAKNKPIRANVSEEVGCACSLLSDDADWNAESWLMRPEIRDRLARTLEILASRGPKGWFVEAIWIGDDVRETVQVTPEELGRMARSDKLGTHTRYAVVTDK